MKKKIGIIGMAFVIAISISACSLPLFNNKKSEKTAKEEVTTEEDAEEKNLYSPIVADGVKAADAEYPYLLKINKAFNCLTVYTLGDSEEYDVAVRSMICSTGGNETPDGSFQIGESTEWEMMPEGNYGRYVTRVVDDVVIRSVNYLAQSEDSLDSSSYNSLGDTVSGSSILLGDADAKWIADNCLEGTKVEIYSDEEEAGPLGKPLARLIPENVKWDPTDPSTENAWYVPVSFKGIEDKVVKVGETPDLTSGVTAKDKYCNDLTAAIKVHGEVDVNKAGKYKVTYSCENTDGNKREVSITVKVVEDGSEEAAAVTPQPTVEATAAPTKEPETTVAATSQPTATPTQTVAAAATSQPTQKAETVTTVTTVQVVDNVAPKVTFTANSAYVSSLADNYLANRISAIDNESGIEGIYISTCRIPSDGSYVIVYEVFDNAGNSTCVSETVYLQ